MDGSGGSKHERSVQNRPKTGFQIESPTPRFELRLKLTHLYQIWAKKVDKCDPYRVHTNIHYLYIYQIERTPNTSSGGLDRCSLHIPRFGSRLS